MTGYRVLARLLRTPVGEIDLIARRWGLLAVVEVKARAPGAEWTVTPAQRRRITRATAYALAQRPEWSQLDIRFDVILVRPWMLPTHLHGAWRPEAWG